MSSFLQQQPIILASGSSIRLKLLKSLGLEFTVVPSHVDEDGIKAAHQSDNMIDLGFALAKAKALAVSKDYAEHFIIAADQLCLIGNRILDKPLNHQTAVEHLNLLNGKTHQQISCVCIARNGLILWQYHDIAHLTLRHLSEQNIEHYLQLEKPYHSCGAYQFETQGKWLFENIEGKEDTILGLPLMALAHALIDINAVTVQ